MDEEVFCMDCGDYLGINIVFVFFLMMWINFLVFLFVVLDNFRILLIFFLIFISFIFYVCKSVFIVFNCNV